MLRRSREGRRTRRPGFRKSARMATQGTTRLTRPSMLHKRINTTAYVRVGAAKRNPPFPTKPRRRPPRYATQTHKHYPFSFPSCAWERNCPRSCASQSRRRRSFACSFSSASGPAARQTADAMAPFAPKLSFGRKCIPKRSLGTRRIRRILPLRRSREGRRTRRPGFRKSARMAAQGPTRLTRLAMLHKHTNTITYVRVGAAQRDPPFPTKIRRRPPRCATSAKILTLPARPLQIPADSRAPVGEYAAPPASLR